MQVANRESFAVASRRRRLPYDAEVEYLESTGTQWIDTPIVAADNVGYDLRIVNWNGAGGNNVSFVFAGVFGSDNRYGLGYSSSSRSVYLFAWWNYAVPNLGNYSVSNGYMRLNYLNSRAYDINGIVTGGLSGTYNASNTTIRLLNAKRMDTGANAFSQSVPMKFSTFKISRGTALVCDMIPVRKGDAGYMYDRVSGRLFGNAGTGSFTLGPDKTSWTNPYVADGLVAAEIAANYAIDKERFGLP